MFYCVLFIFLLFFIVKLPTCLPPHYPHYCRSVKFIKNVHAYKYIYPFLAEILKLNTLIPF